jgi:hypothetical protein
MTYPKEALATYTQLDRATCFVIMPFAPDFDAVYRGVREALALPSLNIRCSRADDIRRPNIIDTILRAIAESEYALADLTGLNPNVFYELGIAHCTKEADKVVLLTQEIDTLPFDLRQLRCIEYRRSAAGIRALKNELIQTFQQASMHSYRFQLREGESHALESRLTGTSRNLFEISFYCRYLGLDGAKVEVRYVRRSLDPVGPNVESDWFYLGVGTPGEKLTQVPWILHLTECAAGEARFVLERAKETE